MVTRIVLTAVLELLRTTENEKFTAMLLQFLLNVSKNEPHVRLYELCGDAARVILQLLVAKHNAWRAETVSKLLELVTRVANESLQCATAMQSAQVNGITNQFSANVQQLVRDRWQNLKLWDLSSAPSEMATALREGSSPEQELLLRCPLLSADKSPRQLLLQLHDGAAILGVLANTSPYAVRKLVVEFAQTAVMTLDVDSRSQLIDFQVRHRYVPLLSLDFLKTLVDFQYVIQPELECREFLEAVRTGTDAQIPEIVDRRQGVDLEYCLQRGLFLAIFERMCSNETTSDDVMDRLWWLLLNILKKVGPYPAIEDDDIQSLVTTVLREIDPIANSPTKSRRMAAKLFQADLFFTPNRQLIVTSGGIPILMRALAYEFVEDVAGRLTGVLQYMVPPELDALVLSLLKAEASPGDPQENTPATATRKRAIYFQNLLSLYGRYNVCLGKLEVAEDRIKNARVAVQVLGQAESTTSKMVKHLALHMLHEYLELDTLDPLRFFDSRDGIRETTKLLREHLGLLVCIVVIDEEPAERRSKQLARRLLTTLAASDPTCREQIRELQKVHQTQPGLVRMELLADDQAEAKAAKVGHEQDGYQYSDVEDDGENIENEAMDDEPQSEEDSDGAWGMVSADTHGSSFTSV